MKALLLLGGLLLSGAAAQAQVTQPATPTRAGNELYQRIARLDAEMFAAFNAHNIPKLIGYFTSDLEFYHDKGSLEVYPIPGYGAIEIGAHRFCHQENGKPDCGTFKFTMLWQQKQGVWRVARVVSCGH